VSKMVTIEKKAAGVCWLDDEKKDEARIERNEVALDGKTWEALRFCKYRNGRHTRVHLVICEEEFVELFGDAVAKGVFHNETLNKLRGLLGRPYDPFLDVLGIADDGKLAQEIDTGLYQEPGA
jgi:hypothetical protein